MVAWPHIGRARGVMMLASFAIAAGAPGVQAQKPAIRVVLVLPGVTAGAASGSDSMAAAIKRGVEFGAAEAAQSAALTGSTYQLALVSMKNAGGGAAGDDASLDSAATRLLRDAAIVVSAVPQQDLTRIARSTRALILDVTPIAQRVACLPRVLRVSAPAADLVHARLWHPALERFGAQQLNERYRRATGAGLGSDEWLGWLSAKLAYELPLRARSVDPDAIDAFARSGRARFDGHKGRALAFDPLTGVLAQPMYSFDPADPGRAPTESEPSVTVQCSAS